MDMDRLIKKLEEDKVEFYTKLLEEEEKELQAARKKSPISRINRINKKIRNRHSKR
jgi:hypothetical protein